MCIPCTDIRTHEYRMTVEILSKTYKTKAAYQIKRTISFYVQIIA